MGKPLGPEPAVVIVEGFLLFSDEKLCEMLDLSLWLDSDCEVCARRRYNREGRPGNFEEYIEDFREEVWRHYELYRGEQLANVPEVTLLNSAGQPQNLVIQALAQRSVVAKFNDGNGESTLSQSVAVSGEGAQSSSPPLGGEMSAAPSKQSAECTSM